MGKNNIQADVEIQEALNKENLPMVVSGISVNQIALMEPDKATAVVQNRINALETIRKHAIRSTNPENWVGFKDAEGNVNYILASSGAVKVRKYYGISTVRLRPDEPQVFTNAEGHKAAKIMGDAYCALTGEVAPNLIGCRSEAEHFTGRGTIEDLKQAARTSLETKAVRILAGMVSIPEQELVDCGIDISKCRKGSGFGTSAERKAGKVTDPKVKKLQDELREKLLKHTGGVEAKASDILKEITANPPKFDGFSKVSGMTQEWQVKQALEKIEVLMSEGGK